MLEKLSLRLRDLAYHLFDEEVELLPAADETNREDLVRIVARAKQEWLDAQDYFNNALEPELVDHAILSVQAAERKYMYWLKQVKTFE